MRSFGTAALYGLLIWAIVFAVAILAFPFREADRPLFESIMPVSLSMCTAIAASIRFARVRRRALREGVVLGVIWLAVNLAFDALMFSRGPMQMGLVEYLKDIGLTYLIIPTITIAMGVAHGRQAEPPATAR